MVVGTTIKARAMENIRAARPSSLNCFKGIFLKDKCFALAFLCYIVTYFIKTDKVIYSLRSVSFDCNINNSNRRAVDSTTQVASAYFIARLQLYIQIACIKFNVSRQFGSKEARILLVYGNVFEKEAVKCLF